MVIELVDDEEMEAVLEAEETKKHEHLKTIVSQLKSLPPPAAPGVNIDLKSTFIALVGVAMCVGKSPLSINPSEVKKIAFTLGNKFFDPDGSLTK